MRPSSTSTLVDDDSVSTAERAVRCKPPRSVAFPDAPDGAGLPKSESGDDPAAAASRRCVDKEAKEVKEGPGEA